MMKYFENIARAMMGMPYGELNETEQHVIKSIANQETVATNLNQSFHDQLTFGQKVSDKVAEFGGSWPFIIMFLIVMLVWIGYNALALSGTVVFDPYPFILLNLVLSTLAALQAPIIMMSQNRQAAKDRMAASLNYQVSLKTDLEIMLLQKKLDELLIKIDRQNSNEQHG
ncbi:DUF1003 domain-containing protein [Planctobacterium marinum]|uniref:DUF1003 domain-containing protein n=1 Tax=Planctobacterium marinum TaxID=1631968 RepID=A0AA48KV25_9ALTE|nr:hypothetical protein MACH26_25910 [Planctobacterium marinum]